MIALAVAGIALMGCGKKDVVLPDAQPVPADLALFQAPALYVPPAIEPVVLPPPQKPPVANERRYEWEDGKADAVPVGIGYPTMVRFQAGEIITSVMDGDREYLSETEAQAAPQQQEQKNCYYGARWQWCKGVSESHYTPVEHLVFTATHVGHKQGVVVFSDRRSYYLELQAVRATKTRLVSWEYPPPPPRPKKPKAPGLFPDLAERRQYHVGYEYTVPDPVPYFTPVKVWSDSKIYLQFSPTVLHQRMPLLRGLDHTGKPFLVNARQAGNWVVVDELAPRLELRVGADEQAQVVIITRGALQTINCPGDVDCPVWP